MVKGLAWSLPYAADRWLSDRLNGWARTLVFPLAFATVEWALSFTPIASSGSPAYSQAGGLALLQLLSVTGLWGITFLIGWCASVVNELWERGSDWRSARGLAAALVAALLVVFLAGSVRLAFTPSSSQPWRPPPSRVRTANINAPTRPIDLAGGNWSTEEQRAALRRGFSRTADQMLARTETAIEAGAKLVAWQESGAWVLVEERAGSDRSRRSAGQGESRLRGPLDGSADPRREDSPCSETRPSLREYGRLVLWTYDKSNPSPYDEAFATIRGLLNGTPWMRTTDASAPRSALRHLHHWSSCRPGRTG